MHQYQWSWILTQNKFLLPCINVGGVDFTNVQKRMIFSDTWSRPKLQLFSLQKKIRIGREEKIRPTRENKPNDICKGQVTLKEVQPLHEIPLWFPYEVDLHSEGKEVVPKVHHTRHDYSECQDSAITSLITDFTFKILPVGWSNWHNATLEELGKRTVPSLVINNAQIKESAWSHGRMCQ